MMARVQSSKRSVSPEAQGVISKAVRGAKVGLWSRDFVAGTVSYSPEWKALLGYADEELESTHAAWEERLHPADRERVLSTLDDCFAGRLPGCTSCDGSPAYDATYRLRHRDGSYRWILARGNCERGEDGQLQRIAGSHVDITDLKLAEEAARSAREHSDEALAVSEAVLSAVFAAAGVGLAVCDEAGIYVWVNPAFCKLSGFREDELLGVSWRSITREEDRDGIERRRRQVMEGNTASDIVERRYVNKTGKTVWIRSQYCRLPAGPDRATSLLVIAEDVTRQREADYALRQSVGNLRSLASRLQRIREEERTRLAREIHDELGQGLTGIKLDAAALSAATIEPSATQRALAIMDSADRTIRSVRRIATDLRPGILDDLGFVAALEWAVEEFQRRVGVSCRVTVPQDNVLLASDRATALFRILQEALTNIARHAEATAVSVRLFKVAGEVKLQVRDNGKGFSEQQIAAGQSLGILGMRERVMILGGTLTIRSQVGDGTLLTVKIPAATPRVGEPAK
jgi:PAS domain S-box-containing protein